MQTDHLLARPVQPSGSSLPADIFRNISRILSRSFIIPTEKRTMSSVAQRNNLFLLTDQVLAFGVEGSLLEFGCHEGSTALAIAMANDQNGNVRQFHVYDDFKFDPKGTGLIKQNLIQGFESAGSSLPIIHTGDILGALIDLPEKIAFVHIDLGFEEEPAQVKYMVRKCLEAVYPRMSPGAICVLNDYHDELRTVKGWDCSPGVKLACDRFLVDKPESINVLFGEEYSHAFFRRSDVT